ncbi:MAG TPA: nitroreductase/quinone reductase family protein [Acidimicrobiia bacterium]|nr:nitroreductase/quinone reductase family protein [Acidimicrobiia bacterium]
MRPEHADSTYGYLRTTGRITGRPHEVEIWFAPSDDVVYLLSGSGGRSDWCRNLLTEPVATFTVDGTEYPVRGRAVTDPAEDALARRSVFEKYRERYAGDLVGWRDASAPFALDPQA